MHTLCIPWLSDQNITDEPLEVFVAAHLNQPTQQFGTQALMLEVVTDQHSKFGFIGIQVFDNTTNAYNLVLAGLRIGPFGDERYLPIVVKKADAYQALVGDALAQARSYAASGNRRSHPKACGETRP